MLYLYFEIKRLPQHPHLAPVQHEIDPPLSSLPGIPRQRMEPYIIHRNIPLRVNHDTLMQRALRHLSGIFNGSFSTVEKDTTKSLGLRGIIRVPEPTSRLQSNREETNANGGTKWRQISNT